MSLGWSASAHWEVGEKGALETGSGVSCPVLPGCESGGEPWSLGGAGLRGKKGVDDPDHPDSSCLWRWVNSAHFDWRASRELLLGFAVIQQFSKVVFVSHNKYRLFGL